MYRVLVVEDNDKIRLELCDFLSKNGYAADSCTNFEHIMEEIKAKRPDLILLDLGLPFVDGHFICKELRRTSNVPIIIVTSRNSEMDELLSMNLGADDYVTKPFSLAVLRARVNSLLRRSRPAPAALELPPFLFDFDAMVFARDGVPLELSKTEQRLLRLLVEHRGQTLSREVLLDRVWDGGEFVDENALSVAVNRLRAKLADAPIRTVYGLGYQWAVD